MLISIHRHKDDNERKLEKFAKEQWQKTRAFLLSRYSLTEDECADVFQDSLVFVEKHQRQQGRIRGSWNVKLYLFYDNM